jgi:gamma-glutamylcyclotransferase
MNQNNKTVYFAYGTLLDKEEMNRFCPSANSLGIMKLPDYRLKFAYCKKNSNQGGCHLESYPGNTMYGVLYELPQQELKDLDQLSGHGDGLWTSMKIHLITEKGEKIPAQTYIIPTPGDDFSPSESYVRPIFKGLNELPFPEKYKAQVFGIIKKAMNR